MAETDSGDRILPMDNAIKVDPSIHRRFIPKSAQLTKPETHLP
jgi:hypothetical protein